MADSHALTMDTSAEIRRIQIARWASTTSVCKAEMIDALCRDTRELARAGLKGRFPDAVGRERALRLGALTIDRDLMIEAFGWDPDLKGR